MSETDLTGGLSVEREYVLAECPDDGVRDAVNVWIEEENGAFGMRIGIEAAAPQWDRHEIWLDIAFADGRVLSRRMEGEVHPAIGPEGMPTIRGAGPLTFRCVEPFRVWTASYDGQAADITAEDLIRNPKLKERDMRDVSFEIEMTMAVPPWVSGSLISEAGATLGSGVEGGFMSPRYEQLFRCRGTLRIEGEERTFAGTGLRIRRTGPRQFEGFWGHCWQSALFPSGKAFGYCKYPPRPDGTPSFNEGFVFDGSGALKPARAAEVPWLMELLPSGDAVPLRLETKEGDVAIDGTCFINTRSRGSAILPPDFPIVQQAHARYAWDGEQACGMLERSTPPSKMTVPPG